MMRRWKDGGKINETAKREKKNTDIEIVHALQPHTNLRLLLLHPSSICVCIHSKHEHLSHLYINTFTSKNPEHKAQKHLRGTNMQLFLLDAR